VSEVNPRDSSSNENLKIWIPVGIITLIGFVVAYSYVPPPPPKKFILATGGPTGQYFANGKRYAEILKKQGFTVELRNSKGSVENLGLLMDDASGVTVALVQGGTATKQNSDKLCSIASLYLEPLWVFHRGAMIQRLSELKGKKLAIGPLGSGTRPVAERVLEENGLDAKNTSLSESSGIKAAQQLIDGTIDAAFFVTGAESKVVKKLLQVKGVHLMSFDRAKAYQRRDPFLSGVTLFQGLVDLEHNIPDRDTVLIAPTATLVARADTHPAVIQLMLGAAVQVHRTGGRLEEPGAYPSWNVDPTIPLHYKSRRYLESGPSALYRFLPFWLASLFDRLKIMLLPLATLLIPLGKIAPPLVRWRIRYRIFRWYKVLKEVDAHLRLEHGTQETLMAERERLLIMEREIAEVKVPLSYMSEYYSLRLHVEFALNKLEGLMEKKSMSGEFPAAPASLIPGASEAEA